MNRLKSAIVSDSIFPLRVVGLGGGCHWCTEGVFASLIGVSKVSQGWIAPQSKAADYSEAIQVTFDPSVIDLQTLVKIHLYTHASTSSHSMRGKYRSDVYAYDQEQFSQVEEILNDLESEFDQPIITQVYRFGGFKTNKPELLDYLYSSPDRPFCKTYIHPKLKTLIAKFGDHVNTQKLSEAGIKLT